MAVNTNAQGGKIIKAKRNSQFREVWLRLRKNPRAMICLAVIIVLLLVAIFADVIASYEGKAILQNARERLQPPSAEHWFGTDNYGRDVFARIVHGTRVSLLIGIGSTAISLTIGVIVGTSAAYFGGRVDDLITRAIDTLIVIPALMLALAIVAGLGVGLPQLIVALAAGKVANFCRIVRSGAMTVANQEYIEVAKARGASHIRIICKYIIPNIISIILIQGTMQVSSAITMGATLSFAGLGVAVPQPEWGNMLSEGLEVMTYYPHLVVIPGIVLMITSLSISSFGDCLRDAFDPRLKGKA